MAEAAEAGGIVVSKARVAADDDRERYGPVKLEALDRRHHARA